MAGGEGSRGTNVVKASYNASPDGARNSCFSAVAARGASSCDSAGDGYSCQRRARIHDPIDPKSFNGGFSMNATAHKGNRISKQMDYEQAMKKAKAGRH